MKQSLCDSQDGIELQQHITQPNNRMIKLTPQDHQPLINPPAPTFHAVKRR